MKYAQKRQQVILDLLETRAEALTPKEIVAHILKENSVTELTIKRDLAQLVIHKYIVRTGEGRATRYKISNTYRMIAPLNSDKYFAIEVDKRKILNRFQFTVFDCISEIQVFDDQEKNELKKLTQEFRKQKSMLSPVQRKKEFERLTIELSWKSSEIEGNTYSLLETESLLRDGAFAKGKSKHDAQMLLNHRKTLNEIRSNEKYFKKVSLPKIEELHHHLVEKLDIASPIRKTLVSITGTNYRPLDNQFQIKEALQHTCTTLNECKDVYEKAFWSVLLISYIQPFEDGNKRTSRMLSTALLLSEDAIPLSYRSVDSSDYKKAILLFYEKNNISAFKNLFLEQVRFAADNYFRAKLK